MTVVITIPDYAFAAFWIAISIIQAACGITITCAVVWEWFTEDAGRLRGSTAVVAFFGGIMLTATALKLISTYYTAG